MDRKHTRLRRTYLHRRALLLKESQQEASILTKTTDAKQAELTAQYDTGPKKPIEEEDEYQQQREPHILLTTSREPSSRLQAFASECSLLFNAHKLNRGKTQIKELVNAANEASATHVILLHETRGTPDTIIISHLPFGPTIHLSLHNVVLRHDIEQKQTVSTAAPHLLFQDFESKLGKRIQKILSHLFPVPKEKSQRVMTFANRDDFISFRHHVYHKINTKDVQLAEVGPRFEMRPFMIKLGAIDSPDADIEWVLRTYMRTTKKRKFL